MSGQLNVDGAGGTTFVNLYGASSRADIEQFTGRQTEVAAFDANGNPVYNGGFFFIQ